MHNSTRKLTAAAAGGDTESLAELFRTRYSFMYAEARKASGRDESFCLDVVQEAMIRVMRSIKPVDSEASLRSWLGLVVKSCAYDRIRKEKARRSSEQTAFGGPDTQETDRERLDRLAWLRNAIRSAKGPHARLLVLRYRLGWTLEQIAEMFGLKTGAVDGRLRRQVAALQRRAREEFNE